MITQQLSDDHRGNAKKRFESEVYKEFPCAPSLPKRWGGGGGGGGKSIHLKSRDLDGLIVDCSL